MNDREVLLELGEKIKRLRQLKSLTQYELADKCQMNRNYIGMIERGERNPTYLTLLKIAEGCDVNISELF